MHRLPLLLFLLCCLLPAQVVRVANIAPVSFSGWVRTTVDIAPPHAAGAVGDTTYVVGRSVGLETRVLDLRVTLAAGEERSIDLAGSTSIEFALAPLPTDPLAHFGGACTFAGEPLALVGLQPDGAAWLATMRGRVGRMFVVTVWVPWFPDQPAWAYGECAVIASNPAVPDMVATAPPGAALQFGSALTILPGRGLAPFLTAGDTFADGQGRVAPVMFFWLQHLRRASEWSSVGAAADWSVSAVGVSRVWADGNPTDPASFHVRSWIAGNLPESARRLWTWDEPVIGPAIRSSASGGQEEQFWTRGEPMLHPAATKRRAVPRAEAARGAAVQPPRDRRRAAGPRSARVAAPAVLGRAPAHERVCTGRKLGHAPRGGARATRCTSRSTAGVLAHGSSPCSPHEDWRSRPESNWGRRICNPLPNHLATGPSGPGTLASSRAGASVYLPPLARRGEECSTFGGDPYALRPAVGASALPAMPP